MIGGVAPSIFDRLYTGARLKTPYEALGYPHLRAIFRNIAKGTADETVRVGFINRIGIDKYITADTHVSALLNEVGTAAAKSD
jgi:hypothetical protein